MSEWWTYSISDLILFSASAYRRLFELYNAAIWPAPAAALGLGVAAIVLARRATPAAGRWVAGILAACWLWIALAFLAARYAILSTAGPWYAWAFGVEAVLMLLIGMRMTFGSGGAPVGTALVVLGVAAYPLAAPLLGGWKAAQVFGVAPDPTAIATLGILVQARVRGRWVLMIIPVVWCAVTGATLWALKSPDFWVAPAAGAAAIVAAWRSRRPIATTGAAVGP